jgi:hypothetical protein
MPRILLPLLLALLAPSLAHGYELRRFCDRGGTCFECAKGTPTCEVTYALSRGLTPPTAPRINPMPVYPERVLPPAARPPAPRQRSEDEWRQSILDEAQRFCEAYPKNQQCHFKEPPPQ